MAESIQKNQCRDSAAGLSPGGRELVAKRAKSHRMVGYVCLFIAAIPWYAAAAFFSKAQERLDTWSQAEGVVIDLRKIRSAGTTRSLYYPQFRFTAANGQDYTVTSTTGSRPPSCERGEKIVVLYPEDKPQEAVMKSFMSLYLPSLVCCFFGLFPGAISFGHFYSSRQLMKKLAEEPDSSERVS